MYKYNIFSRIFPLKLTGICLIFFGQFLQPTSSSLLLTDRQRSWENRSGGGRSFQLAACVEAHCCSISLIKKGAWRGGSGSSSSQERRGLGRRRNETGPSCGVFPMHPTADTRRSYSVLGSNDRRFVHAGDGHQRRFATQTITT